METLLFQAGYLTIKSTSGSLDKLHFHMGFPNREVEDSWLFTVMNSLVPEEDSRREDHLDQLVLALESLDLARFFELLRNVFFAKIPYQLHIYKEKYYQTIFHTLFLLLQVRIRSEVSTNVGRIDGVLETDQTIFLFEFKYNDSAEKALQQIRDRGYGDGYRDSGKSLVGVGVSFADRNIADWTHQVFVDP